VKELKQSFRSAAELLVLCQRYGKSISLFFFFKQKTAYGFGLEREFRLVLFQFSSRRYSAAVSADQ
ncbi:hypothetical protein C3E98_042855, partial [Pseudomonas sp. MWU13-2625]